MIPPCPDCIHYTLKERTLFCFLKPQKEPLFYATLKNGPEFKCFEENKNARNRPNPV